MKISNRLMAALLALMLIVGLFPMSADAQDVLPDNLPAVSVPDLNVQELRPLAQTPVDNEINAANSGTCGSNLTWTLENSILTISGTGDMQDYSQNNSAPWFQFASGIKKIIVEDGVTCIGDYAFYGCAWITNAYISATVTQVGSHIWDGSNNAVFYFLGDAPEIDQEAFMDAKYIIYFFRAWDETFLQPYGGQGSWNMGSICLSDENRTVYALNEQIDTDDLLFDACGSADNNYPYTPAKVTLGTYDNSTYGQKSVSVTVDGTALTYTYFVSEGSEHLDAITVEYDRLYYYDNKVVFPNPVVKYGDQILKSGVDYTISHQNNSGIGIDASFTITGKGLYEGFEKVCPYAILRSDLATADVTVQDAAFYGMYMEPELDVQVNDYYLTRDTHYDVVYKNNVNVGTGSVRVIGKESYCGSTTANFQIIQDDTSIDLNGTYNGSAYDESLNDEYYYEEGLMCPGIMTGSINSSAQHIAYYVLYRVEGDEAVMVTEYESDYGYSYDTSFVYDFTDVYNSTSEDGGEVYMLSYSWMDSSYNIYSGVCVMYIPAKVPGATAMTMEYVPDENDFRYEYLTVYGDDGVLGDVTWTSSNDAIATVSDGAVTFKKPGTVTITAKSGSLTANYDVSASAQDLTQAVIFSYDTTDSTANVIFDCQLLQSRTDYVLTTSTDDDIVTVTATGRGLFEGQIMRQFDAATGEAVGHTHTFDNACDATCNSCEFTRETAHQYGTAWTKDMDGHWYACTVCGDRADYDEHTLSPDDDTLCTVCGTLYIPGDLNQDFTVNEDDAIYLLQHVLLPDYFPVEQAVDYTGDGQVNEDDAIYLLQHVLLPDFFPL